MTKEQVAYLAATDPVVVRAHTQSDPATGRAEAMPFDKLNEKAMSVIDLAIPRLLQQESVKRKFLTSTYTILAADISGDNAIMPKDVGQVLHIISPATSARLDKLGDPSEVAEWLSDRGIDATSSTDATVLAFYSYDRTQTGRIKVHGLPSATGLTGMEVWYERDIGDPPYSMSIIPSRLHYIIYDVVLAYMRGQNLMDAIMAVVGETAENIEAVEPGVTKMHHDDVVERSFRSVNTHFSQPY